MLRLYMSIYVRMCLTRKPFAVNTNPFFDDEPADKD